MFVMGAHCFRSMHSRVEVIAKDGTLKMERRWQIED
jgi:hypothetical protein